MTEASGSNFCQRCGQSMIVNAVRCGSCGAPVSKPSLSSNKVVLIVVICCVVGVVGLFAAVLIGAVAIGFADGSQARARDEGVRANMRTVQIAAESYATDTGGMYPTAMDTAFKSYFEGGDAKGTVEGKPPVNPFTNKGEWPVIGKLDWKQNDDPSASHDLPGASTDVIGKGVLEYSPQDPPTTYAIRGGDHSGHPIDNPQNSKMMVLSNY